MYINGEWRELAETFPVFNPANGEQIGEVADGGQSHAAEAIDAAAAALPAWSAATAYERSAALYRAHQLMMERQRQLAELMTREQGKPLKASTNEVKYAADFLRGPSRSHIRLTNPKHYLVNKQESVIQH